MLQSLVEEHLRYGEDISTLTDELNVETPYKGTMEIKVLKVTQKATREEMMVLGNDVIETEGDTRSKYHFDVRCVSKAAYQQREQDDELSQLYRDSFRVTVVNSELVFQQGTRRVFESDGFIIITEEVVPDYTQSRDYLYAV
jgi:hypothetical protein